MPICTVLPRLSPFSSSFFSFILTNHKLYIVHSENIKCPLFAVRYWLAFAELSKCFLLYSFSSRTALFFVKQNIFFLANLDQVKRNLVAINALASWSNIDSCIGFTLVGVFSRNNQAVIGGAVVHDDSNRWRTLSITQAELYSIRLIFLYSKRILNFLKAWH